MKVDVSFSIDGVHYADTSLDIRTVEVPSLFKADWPNKNLEQDCILEFWDTLDNTQRLLLNLALEIVGSKRPGRNAAFLTVEKYLPSGSAQ